MQKSRDWYRRTSWTPDDQKDFFARLKRARGKSQYLLLQAQALLQTRLPDRVAAALNLLDILISEHADPFFLSNAHLARAEALVALDRPSDAVPAFRAALQARRALPNVINGAYLAFAWAVGRLRLRNCYDEVLAVMREFHSADDLAFPVNAYRYFGALALIAADSQDATAASQWASHAIRAASADNGPFARHPGFGVLDPAEVDPESHRLLCELATAR